MAWDPEELQLYIEDLKYELSNIEKAIADEDDGLFTDSISNSREYLSDIEGTSEHGELLNIFNDLVSQGKAAGLRDDMPMAGGRRRKSAKVAKNQKVYVAKNGAKYVKNEKGQVRFISGASKTYMEKIRNKRKGAKKSPVKPARKSAKKTSARAKIHAAIKVAQAKAAKEQKKAAKKIVRRLSKRASKKQK